MIYLLNYVHPTKLLMKETGFGHVLGLLNRNPSFTQIAVAGQLPTIQVYSFDSLTKSIELFDTIQSPHKKTIRYLSYAPSGLLLAAASFDGTVSVHLLNDNVFDCVSVIEGHENEVKCVEWCPNGRWLTTCSRDKSIWVWDHSEDFEFFCVAVINAHTADVKSIKWIPGPLVKGEVEMMGCGLASTSYDETIKIWQPEIIDDDCDFFELQKITVG